jgi:hypothetical protein
MSDKIILQPMQPQRFEGRNIRTPKRSNATDDVYLFQMEITREAWEALESIPKTNMVEGVLWHHDGDPVGNEQPEEKPKKEPTPYGLYWREWLKEDRNGAALIFSTMLIDALKLDGEPATKDTIHEALRAVMGVTSLSREVSPDAFEAWLDERQLVGLKTMSRQITARLQREEAKAS